MTTPEKLLKPLKKLLNGLEDADLKHNIDYKSIEYCINILYNSSPLKKGDRVELIKTPDFEKAPGWVRSQHFLKIGAKGTVKTVELSIGKFTYFVEFDDESWLRTFTFKDGKLINIDPPEVVPVEDEFKSVYGFALSSLAKI